MSPSLKDLEHLVQEARKAGARGAEALVSEHVGTRVTLEGRKPPARAPREGASLLVRCWLDGGRCGEATGSPSAADALVAKAIRAAAKADEDPFSGPVRRMPAPAGGLGIDDPRHEQISDADRVDILTSNQRAAEKADTSLTSGRFWYDEVREVRRFANHHGVSSEVAHTTYEAGGSVTLRAGGVTLNDAIAGRAFASIACLPFGAALARRAEALSGKGPTMSGPMRALLPPRVVGRIVAWLAEMFGADDLAGSGTFVARAAGEPLFHRRIHLVDDGALPGGLRTRGFDDRGVTPVPLTLLKEGVVSGRLLDVPTARRLETRPTGHRWPEGLRPTNLQIHAGARSVNAWMGEQEAPVFEIDDMDPTGIDPASGDIDTVVNGRVREKHDMLGAVRGVRITGNLVDVLKNVHGVASDTDRIGHVDAPAIFVDGLTFGD